MAISLLGGGYCTFLNVITAPYVQEKVNIIFLIMKDIQMLFYDSMLWHFEVVITL